jgi:hypothetical protein
MTPTTAWLAASALLLSGCVIREVHEVRYVHDQGGRAPGATASSAAPCDRCEATSAPGAVMADSQPPAPLEEEPLDQPGDGYVWTDGYWNWDGDEWDWTSGSWMVPPLGEVFVPPSYYAYGGGCLYVPGRWETGDRPRGPRVQVRDHRTHRRPEVRDHRTKDKRPRRPERRDHRGETPGGVDRQDDRVITVPPRRPSRTADRAAQDRFRQPDDASSVTGTVPASGASDIIDGRDVRDHRGDHVSDGPSGVVVVPPRGRPDRSDQSVRAAPDRGPDVQPADRPNVLIAPPPPSARPGGWSRPERAGGWSHPGRAAGWSRPAPPTRNAPSGPPVVVSPSPSHSPSPTRMPPSRSAQPSRSAPPVHSAPPSRSAPPVRSAPPSRAAPSAPPATHRAAPARSPGSARSHRR